MLIHSTAPELAAASPVVRTADRVVLKIGTSSLVTAGAMDPVKVARLCAEVHRAVREGLAPVLVASGAIAVGRGRHSTLADADPAVARVAAAVGQAELYAALRQGLARYGVHTGQLLVTPYDLVDPERAASARGTLHAMLALGFVPVVNENDVLGVRNNDVLAALVSGFLGARMLLLLTDVPGLYDGNPLLGGAVRRIATVPALTPALEAVAGGTGDRGGTGGMLAKLSACWIATYCGVRTVVADAATPEVLLAAYREEPVGTVFQPRPVDGTAGDIGRLWRAFRTPPVGRVELGPAGLSGLALGRPLLAGHLRSVGRAFRAGDVVDIGGPDGRVLARGGARCDAEPRPPAGTALFEQCDYVTIAED